MDPAVVSFIRVFHLSTSSLMDGWTNQGECEGVWVSDRQDTGVDGLVGLER